MEHFINSFAARFPDIKRLLDEHLRDQHGEILTHHFFWAVTNHVLSLSREGSAASLNQAGDIVNFLEEHYREGDEHYEVRNLIEVSFLEDLQHEGEATSRVVRMLGPKLTCLWQEEGFKS
jgi:hypothetical protein